MNHSSAAHFQQADYDAIESALLGSSKGQWFLREFLGRNRGAETLSMLHAVSRLHSVLVGDECTAAQQAGRDMRMLIEDIRRSRRLAMQLDGELRASHLLDLVAHMEAQLMAVNELLEDVPSQSRFIEFAERLGLPAPEANERTAKLYGELSAMVSGDENDPAYDC